ncbi:MAG: protein kinase domain-containing protein [Cuspidothrix sp.]
MCINPNCQKRQNPDNELFCRACGSQLLLQGRYRVIRELGKGGFGQTYEVNEVRTNQPKVLKVLINYDPKAIALFKQEAEVLSQLHHPGIPQVEADAYFEYYPYSSQTPIHCFVMEKIEGEDLEQYMIKRGLHPIDQTLAIQWLKDLLNILKEVHHQKFFHRDIKPPNIMLRAKNAQLTLIDFGTIRKVTTTVVNKQGGVTQILSPGYTPSEQITGGALPQSDFFALGRTFVYLLTGKQPLDPEIYDTYNDLLKWRSHAPQISSMLADLLDDMMQRLSKDRPQTAEKILRRIADIEKALKPQPKTPLTPINIILILTTILFSGLVGYLLKPSPENNTSSQPTVIKTNTPLKQTDEIKTPSQPTVIKTNNPSIPVTQTTPPVTPKNITTATLINTLTAHSKGVIAVAISRDGQTLVSGSDDDTIKIWNLGTGELKSTLTGHSSSVWSLAISPDGQTLVSGSSDDTIKIWRLE